MRVGLPAGAVMRGGGWDGIQLVEIEAAFKNLKDDLQLRPIYHQLEHRIEAHILMCSSDCSWFVAARRRFRV
jgi:hypothetical protein